MRGNILPNTVAMIAAAGIVSACQTADVAAPTEARAMKVEELTAEGHERLTGSDIPDAMVGRTFGWVSEDETMSGTISYLEDGVIEGTWETASDSGPFSSDWYLANEGSLWCERSDDASGYHECAAVLEDGADLLLVFGDARVSRLEALDAADMAATDLEAFRAEGAEPLAVPLLVDETGETMVVEDPYGATYWTPDGDKIRVRDDGTRTDRRWSQRNGIYCEELVGDGREICLGEDPEFDRFLMLGEVVRVFNSDGSLAWEGTLTPGEAPIG